MAEEQYLIFKSHGSNSAVSIEFVDRVVHASAIIENPNRQGRIGFINLAGEVTPVYDIDTEQIFHHSQEPIKPEQKFIILSSPRLKLILLIDEIIEIDSLEVNQRSIEEGPYFLSSYRNGMIKVINHNWLFGLQDHELRVF
ncbi:MAG: hypothetical protein CMO81_10230 [Waddliaceae bacterium]|nr:hypothetical protein [Waddliaceae bacterium]